jgi:hypothetical protein
MFRRCSSLSVAYTGHLDPLSELLHSSASEPPFRGVFFSPTGEPFERTRQAPARPRARQSPSSGSCTWTRCDPAQQYRAVDVGIRDCDARRTLMPGNRYYRSKHWRKLRALRLALDEHRCSVPGCRQRATVVDHIQPRPADLTVSCDLDRIGNLRSLCGSHDSQVKEQHGKRKQGGKFRIVGCDASGRSLDPRHPWNRE